MRRDATPEDYDNEELYMEMGKIYFAVSRFSPTLFIYSFKYKQAICMCILFKL